MHTSDNEIEHFLVDSGIISKKSLEDIKKLSKEREESLGRILLDKGLLSEDDFRRVEAFSVGVPFVDLKKREIDIDTLSIIPEPLSRSRNIVAIKRQGKTLEVAVLELSDLDELDFIKDKYGLKILPRLTDQESMKQVLVHYQKLLKEEFGDVIKAAVSTIDEDPDSSAVLVDTVLKHAVISSASDIHIDRDRSGSYIRYRIEGKLYDAMLLPNIAADAFSDRLKEVANLEPNSDLDQEGRFTVEMNEEKLTIRISISPTKYGDKIVLKLLRQSSSGFSLEGLGMNHTNIDKIHEILRRKEGLVLVSGPAVSGKTTTLYTLVDMLNTPERSVATIEEEIEFELPRVNQTELDTSSGFTYARGLRSILRQDPDVIMIGEISDSETANLTLAAIDRCLVLSGLKADSVRDTVSKLINLHIDTEFLASALQLIIFTKLVPRLDDNKEKYFLNKSELDTLSRVAPLQRLLEVLRQEKLVADNAGWESVAFYKSRYAPKGFVGIQEVISISSLMRTQLAHRDIRALSSTFTEASKPSFLEDGILKAVRGEVALEDVLLSWKELKS